MSVDDERGVAVGADVAADDWRLPSQPWWVKLRRASVHIRDVRAGVDALLASQPCRVESEHAGGGRVVHRVRLGGQPDGNLAATVGDAVHNLRSALDAAAYGLALRHFGPMEPAVARAPSFRSFERDREFRHYMRRTIAEGRAETFADLYGPTGVLALQSVQPYATAMDAQRHGIQRATTPSQDLRIDGPYRLDKLWNTDKHRGVLRLRWFFEDLFWMGEAVPCAMRAPFMVTDGDIVAEHVFPSPDAVRPLDSRWSFGLALDGDPAPFVMSITDMLDRWHRSVGGWVIPRMFITAATGQPPILISGGWPIHDARTGHPLGV